MLYEVITERLDFYKATEDLREALYQKELELRSELAKPEPDAQKAAVITSYSIHYTKLYDSFNTVLTTLGPVRNM